MVGVSVEVRAQWPIEAFVGARGENTGAVRGVQTGAAEVSLSLESILERFFVEDPKSSVDDPS